MKATQKMIRPFVSTCSLRPAMHGVRFDKKRKVFEATNGHTLIEWIDEEFSVGIRNDCVLPIEVFPVTSKDRRALVVKGRMATVTIFEPIKRGDGVDVRGKTIKDWSPKMIRQEIYPLTTEKFPNTQKVWPDGDSSSQNVMCFDPGIVAAFDGFCRASHRYGGMIMTFYGPTSPCAVKPDAENGEWRGLIMPMRIGR
ncbi:MAG: hypothetical protein HGB02_08745 [Chlorobiaceae bacterium]|nr:hypothetical protein [Chlorobiaceae bacterium]